MATMSQPSISNVSVEDIFTQFSGDIDSIRGLLETQWLAIRDQLNSTSCQKVSELLSMVSRQSGLPPIITARIMDFILEKVSKNFENKNIVLRKLCETVKYAVRHNLQQLDETLDNSILTKIANTILKTLLKTDDTQSQAYLMETLTQLGPQLLRDPSTMKNIKSVLSKVGVTSSFSENERRQILERINSSNRLSRLNKCHSQSDLFKLIEKEQAQHRVFHRSPSSGTNSYLSVHVSQQVSTTINYNSEKNALRVMNLCDSFKHRNDLLQQETKVDILPENINLLKDGTDTRFYKDTYGEVKTLWDLAETSENENPIKIDDWDGYLAQKLLGAHYWYKIFVLLKYRDIDVDSLITRLFQKYAHNTKIPFETVDKCFKIIAPAIDKNAFIANFNLRYNHEYEGFTIDKLVGLRLFAVQILQIASRRNWVIFTEDRLNMLRGYLGNYSTYLNADWNTWKKWKLEKKPTTEEEIRRIKANLINISDIMDDIIRQDDTNASYISLAENGIKGLTDSERNLTDDQIATFAKSIERIVYQDGSLVEKIFTQDLLSNLTSIMTSTESEPAKRKACRGIVSSYLTNVRIGLLSSDLLRPCFAALLETGLTEDDISGIFAICIQALDKLKQTQAIEDKDIYEFSKPLLESMGRTESVPNWNEYVVLAVNQFFEDVPETNYGKIVPNMYLIRMMNSTQFVQTNQTSKQIEFVEEQNDSESATPMSLQASNLVQFLIQTGSIEWHELPAGVTIADFINPLINSTCPQTRIRTATILGYLKDSIALDENTPLLPTLRSLLTLRQRYGEPEDVIFWCSAISTLFSLRITERTPADELRQEKDLIMAPISYFNLAGSTLDYQYEDVGTNVNTQILALAEEAGHKGIISKNIYPIADIILEQCSTSSSDYVSRVLRILQIMTAMGDNLPESTLSKLDVAFETEEATVTSQVFQIWNNCIKNQQTISNLAIGHISKFLYKTTTEYERDIAFQMLQKAFYNQDLEPQQYNTFIKELTLRTVKEKGGQFISTRNLLGRLTFLKTKLGESGSHELTMNNLHCLQQILGESAPQNLPDFTTVQLHSLHLLATAAENGQNFPDTKLLLETIIIDKVLKVDMNLDLLASVAHLLLAFQNKNRTIPGSSKLMGKLEQIIFKLAENGKMTLFCDIFRIIANITKTEKKQDPNYQMNQTILSYVLTKIKENKVGEDFLRDLIPLFCDVLTNLPETSGIFTDLVNYYNEVLGTYNSDTNLDISSIKGIIHGIETLGAKLPDLASLIQKIIDLAQNVDDYQIKAELVQFLETCPHTKNLLNDAQKIQLVQIRQTTDPISVLKSWKTELGKVIPKEITIRRGLDAVCSILDSKKVHHNSAPEFDSLIEDTLQNLNNTIKHAGIRNILKIEKIRKETISRVISILIRNCDSDNSPHDELIVTILRTYFEILQSQSPIQIFQLSKSDIAILCGHVRKLESGTINKNEYTNLIRNCIAFPCIQIDPESASEIQKILDFNQIFQDTPAANCLPDLDNLLQNFIKQRNYTVSREDRLKYMTAGETLVNSIEPEVHQGQIVNYAKHLSIFEIRDNTDISIQMNQSSVLKFAEFMRQVIPILCKNSDLLNPYIVPGLTRSLQILKSDCHKSGTKLEVGTFFNLINIIEQKFGGNGVKDICKFDFALQSLKACRDEDDFSQITVSNIRNIFKTGVQHGAHPLVKFTVYHGFSKILSGHPHPQVESLIKQIIGEEGANQLKKLCTLSLTPGSTQVNDADEINLLKGTLLSYSDEALDFTGLNELFTYHQNDKAPHEFLQLLLAALLRGSVTPSDIPEIIALTQNLGFLTAAGFLSETLCPFPSSLVYHMARYAVQSSQLSTEICNVAKNALDWGLKFTTVQQILQKNCEENTISTDLLAVFTHLKDYYDLSTLHNDLTQAMKTTDPRQTLIELQTKTLLGAIPEINPRTRDNFRSLLKKGFNFEDLKRLVVSAVGHKITPQSGQPLPKGNNNLTLEKLVQLLDQFIVNDDKKSEQIMAQFMKIVERRDVKKMLKSITAILLNNIFSSKQKRSSKEPKNLEEICSEFAIQNPDFIKQLTTKISNTPGETEISVDKSAKMLINIISSIRATKKVTQPLVEVDLQEWTRQAFQDWGKSVKSNWKILSSQENFLIETLAVLAQANKLSYGYELTDSQLLCIYLSVSRPGKNSKGLLQQLVTGGGKSAVIRILAALSVLSGNKVFVSTSNSVLAQRDSSEAAVLFRYFNITSDHNKDKGNYITGAKTCYGKDVVFGEACQFQFDILRHEFGILTTLGDISKSSDAVSFDNHVIFVDEVDFLLIDESSKFARLSADLPGLDLLEPIYHFVWDKLCSMQDRIFTTDGINTYLAFGKLVRDEEGKLMLETIQSIGEEHDQIVHLDICELIRTNEYHDYAVQIKSNIATFIQTSLEIMLEKWTGIKVSPNLNPITLRDNPCLQKLAEKSIPSEFQIKIPSHLLDFVAGQIPIWPKSAIIALFEFREGVNYIVDDGMIKPVDFESTGMIRGNQNWGDGVQQFLQLKHNLAISPETLATNYMSTISFFRRFTSQNLFGFTGTFGSSAATKFVENVFNVDTVLTPASHWKNFHEYETLTRDNKQDWMDTIVDSVDLELTKGRAVLIVCRSIRMASEIRRAIRNSKLNYHSLRMYTKNNTDEDKHVERVVPGDIIIATNLAGRGTDIKSSPMLESNGGLHICMTFLPPNLRAEWQIKGRTARNGNYGTAQFIIYTSTSGHQISDQNARDELEKRALNDFETLQLPTIELKETYFREMCEFLSNLRTKLKDHDTLKRKFLSKLSLIGMTPAPSAFERYIMASVEELWALYVKRIDHKICPDAQNPKQLTERELESVKTQFSNFFKELSQKISTCKTNLDFLQAFVKNPFYSIRIGNAALYNGETDISGCIVPYFQHAIDLDPTFASAAYVGQGCCFIRHEKRNWYSIGAQDKYCENYKSEATQKFIKGIRQLALQQSYVSFAFTLLHERNMETSQSSYPSDSYDCELAIQLNQKYVILGNYVNGVKAMIEVIKESERLIDLVVHQSSTNSVNYFNLPRQADSPLWQLDPNTDVDVTMKHLTQDTDLVNKDQIQDVVDHIMKRHPEFDFKTHGRLLIKAETTSQLVSLLDDNSCQVGLSKQDCVKYLESGGWKTMLRKFIPLIPDGNNIYFTILDPNNVPLSREQGPFTVKKAVEEIKKVNQPEVKFSLRVPTNVPNYYDQASYKVVLKRFTSFSKLATHLHNNLTEQILIKASGKGSKLVNFFDTVLSKIELEQFRAYDFSEDEDRVASTLIRNPSQLDLTEGQLSAFDFIVRGTQVDILSSIETFPGLVFDVTVGESDLIARSQLEPYLKLHTGEAELEIADCEWIHLKNILSEIRQAKMEVSLRFVTITSQFAQEILTGLQLKSEHVDISKIKKLSDNWTLGYTPAELQPIIGRGLELIILLNERPFIPYYSITAVCALGLVQITAAGILVATGVGVPFAIQLMIEGVSDLFYASRVYSNRKFDMKSFAVQKSLSLIISTVSLGFGAASNVATGVVTEVGEQGMVRVILNGKTIGQVVGQCFTNLQNFGAREAGTVIVEMTARECFYSLNSQATEFIANSVGLEDIVKSNFATQLAIRAKTKKLEHHLTLNLDRLSTISKLMTRDTTSLRNLVRFFAQEVTQSTETSWKRQVGAVGALISKAVGGNGALLQTFSLAVTVIGIGAGGSEIYAMIDTFCDQLEQKLLNYGDREYSMEKVLQSKCRLDDGESLSLHNCRAFANSIAVNCPPPRGTGGSAPYIDWVMQPNFLPALTNIDTTLLNRETSGLAESSITTAKDRFIQFCATFQTEFNNRRDTSNSKTFAASYSEINQEILTSLVSQVMIVAKSHMITPSLNHGTNFLVKKMRQKVDQSLVRRKIPSETTAGRSMDAEQPTKGLTGRSILSKESKIFTTFAGLFGKARNLADDSNLDNHSVPSSPSFTGGEEIKRYVWMKRIIYISILVLIMAFLVNLLLTREDEKAVDLDMLK